ncbi:MAG: hypothetical protein U0V70_08580 [Terriglobia bacterium]
MIPGGFQVIACPHCHGIAKYMTLVSGNTLGATNWTDGYQDAPMLPRPPAVVRCRHCARFYWLAEAKELGMLGGWGSSGKLPNPAWQSAEEVARPTEDEYYLALESRLGRNKAQEKQLRILTWWRRNDAFRHRYPAKEEKVPSEFVSSRQNLEALAKLLDEKNDSERIMKAEIFRELGKFHECIALLDKVSSKGYEKVAAQLRLLSDNKDPWVRELRLGT